MKLLILGGSGFVSGRLAQIATAQGHEVWCVTRGNRPIPEGVHALTCDAHDPTALRAALASAQLQWDAALDCICRDAALRIGRFVGTARLHESPAGDFHRFRVPPAYKRVPQDETGVYLHDGGYGSSKRQMEEVFSGRSGAFRISFRVDNFPSGAYFRRGFTGRLFPGAFPAAGSDCPHEAWRTAAACRRRQISDSPHLCG